MAGQVPLPSVPNLSLAPRINATNVISVTPTITAGAYTSGQQIGGILQLPYAVRQEAITAFGTTVLVDIMILDSDKQNSAVNIFLFNQSPTLTSTDHSTFAMTAANFQAQCVGVIAIANTTYTAYASASASENPNLNKPILIPNTVANPNSVYAVVVSAGTPTYTSTSSLQLKFSFYLD